MQLINRILIILSLTLLSTALEATPVFILANEAYQNKDFPQAISLYQESLKLSKSLEQHFNLANAYYENGEFGNAILHYEKALIFHPKNPDVLKNLNLANEALQIYSPQSSTLEVFAHLFSVNTWSWMCTIFVILSITLFFLPRCAPLNNIFIKISSWICFSLAVVTVSIITFYATQLGSGIVLTHETPLRVAPTNSSPTVALLLEGTKAKVIKTKESPQNFLLVKTLNSKEGWISTKDFGLIWR